MNFYPPHVPTLLKFEVAFSWRYLIMIILLTMPIVVGLALLIDYFSFSLWNIEINEELLISTLFLPVSLPAGVIAMWYTMRKHYKTFDVIWFKGPPKSMWQKRFLLPVLLCDITCNIMDWLIITPLTSHLGLQVLGNLFIDLALFYIFLGLNFFPFKLSPREGINS